MKKAMKISKQFTEIKTEKELQRIEGGFTYNKVRDFIDALIKDRKQG